MMTIESVLVTLRSRYLLAILVQHCNITLVIGTSQRDDLVLPIPLLPQEFVDFVVQVTDFVVGQTGFAKISDEGPWTEAICRAHHLGF